MARLSAMIEFLYRKQRYYYEDPWEADPEVSAEVRRRWSHATAEEIEQARMLARECFEADTGIIHAKKPLPDEPPGWH